MRAVRVTAGRWAAGAGAALLLATALTGPARRTEAAACVGDCNTDGRVSIAELMTLVNVALDEAPFAACPAGDANDDGMITVSDIVTAVNATLDGCPQAAACGAGTYTYTFTNSCTEPIFIGQNGPGAASTPPTFPEADNWAVAPACTVANQATICTGPGSMCVVPMGAALGQCSCTADSDCPGSAPCVDTLCSTTTTFCMPQDWSSGVFWPRTGCTLSGQTLTCTTGQCGGSPGMSGGQLDCGAGSSQVGPNPPVVLFESTTSTASANYDVSLNSGYNIAVNAVPVGGGYVFPLTTQAAPCPAVGCVADLTPDCPTYLQTAGGCLDPCTQCSNSAPTGGAPDTQIYAALQCDQVINTDASGNTPASTTACSGTVTGGLPTYQDMYCAKNFEGDGNSMASVNQGTPTAFSQADCFPGTTFVIPTYPTGYSPPAGAGVCLYQSSTPGVNDYSWADLENGLQTCAKLTDGTACGGYRTTQSDGGYFPQALGYACRTVTLPSSFPVQTAHLCLPSTTSGLGTCTTDQIPPTATPTTTPTATPTTANDVAALAPPGQATDTQGSVSLYAAAGGVFNAAWLTAGLQAATSSTEAPYQPGSTPYYETFKAACPSAYAWQYDDAASGFACTVTATVPPNGTFSGFNVSFCPQVTPSAVPTGMPTATASATPSTPTASASPTATATGIPTGTATTAPPSATATGIPAGTATATTTSGPTLTPTTPGSGTLTWILNQTPTTSVSVPLGGMSYAAGALLLNDSGARFCTSAGMQTIASVDFGSGNLQVIGAPPISASQLQVANIPAAPTPGTCDVVIQTNPNCGSPTMLTMPSAIQYQ